MIKEQTSLWLMKHKIERFFRRIYNLYRWLPIIWKDQDWDDFYIFEILKFKLKNQAEYIGKHDRHTSAKRDTQKMLLCVRLIERIQNDYYSMEYYDYHESNLKFIDSESYPGMYEMNIEMVSENFEPYFRKYSRIYKQVFNKDKTNFRIAHDIGHINEERAHKLLFKILERNIRSWWD